MQEEVRQRLKRIQQQLGDAGADTVSADVREELDILWWLDLTYSQILSHNERQGKSRQQVFDLQHEWEQVSRFGTGLQPPYSFLLLDKLRSELQAAVVRLSQQEGIPESQWIYEPNDDGEYIDGMQIRKNFHELEGYRLPTEEEWIYACLAGTSSSYSFGEPETLLKEYGRHALNSSGRSHPVGSLLPNDFGLFDMHGNLWEWTQNAREGPWLTVTNDSPRVLRGGALGYLPSRLVTSSRFHLGPETRDENVGFRPVRTVKLSAPRQ